MQKTYSLPLVGIAILALILGNLSSRDSNQNSFPGQLIIEGMIHLGDNTTPEWPEAAAKPDGLGEYSASFNDSIGGTQRALAFTTRDAHSDWTVSINDQPICKLKHTGEPTEFVVMVPKGIVV